MLASNSYGCLCKLFYNPPPLKCSSSNISCYSSYFWLIQCHRCSHWCLLCCEAILLLLLGRRENRATPTKLNYCSFVLTDVVQAEFLVKYSSTPWNLGLLISNNRNQNEAGMKQLPPCQPGALLKHLENHYFRWWAFSLLSPNRWSEHPAGAFFSYHKQQ